MRRQAGFNLIEIMFALLLLALVITVSVETSSGDLANFNRMQAATYGRWVALNQIATVLTNKNFPSTGKSSGKADMAGQTWEWQQEITPSPLEANLLKIKVTVNKTRQTQPAAVEVGYIANPNPKKPLGQGMNP